MSLVEQINNDLKAAMKGGDKFRTQTLRTLKSAIRYAEIEARETLDDRGVQGVIAKQAKQRRDSIAEFQKGRRDDLVKNEEAELAILESYLPQQMSEEEIRVKAKKVIADLGITDMKGIGQVMKQLMAEMQGQADGKIVNQIVRELLNQP
ncbi:MAG: GatB/YqeY domain-containing protein [Anaerolineae bacterium]|nr:GatB/YqeY domain-containing protein [Anaerolineae bacterium]